MPVRRRQLVIPTMVPAMPEDFAADTIVQMSGPKLTKIDDGLRVILPGEVNAVRRTLEQLVAALDPLGLDAEEKGTLELVVAEALNNIVEHAYSDFSGVLEVAMNRKDDGLHFVITDSGVKMPDGKMPLGKLLEYPDDPEKVPEGGFGWFLIHDLTHELSYRRVGDQNVLRFRLAMGGVDAG